MVVRFGVAKAKAKASMYLVSSVLSYITQALTLASIHAACMVNLVLSDNVQAHQSTEQSRFICRMIV